MPTVTSTELWDLIESQFKPGVLQSFSLTGPHSNTELYSHKVVARPIEIKGKKQLHWKLYAVDGRQTHENISWKKSLEKVKALLGPGYRNAHLKTTQEEIQVRMLKKSKVQISRKQLEAPVQAASQSHDVKKQYLFPEGAPCPFLIATGIMSESGKVHQSMYRKFRQINRFAEFVYDVREHFPTDRPVRIVDYGCGKSYLTFAIRHLLVEKLGLQVQMLGLDSNQEVIDSCQKTKDDLQLTDIHFEKAHIAEADLKAPVDLAIWLHACDTATDDALARSVQLDAKVILASPCCQHEFYKQVNNESLQPLLKHGILRERFAAMATDALRSQLLETIGYRTQIIEFIDLEHTAKNLLLRAIRTDSTEQHRKQSQAAYLAMKQSLNIKRFHLEKLLGKLLPE
ncbi:MAG: SAM-dependent methyltransferase [Planctomycetaceae bacterium]|nr:SAM-dependent methyltransferase [Planctomycetaceae bacterium]